MQRRNEVVREAVDLLLRRRGLHERPKPDEGVSSLTPLKFNEKEAFSKAVSEILKGQSEHCDAIEDIFVKVMHCSKSNIK